MLFCNMARRRRLVSSANTTSTACRHVTYPTSRCAKSPPAALPFARTPSPFRKVRTSALNIVLHVFSVKDPGVIGFLALEENHASFFAQLSRLMQDAYSQILCRVSSRSGGDGGGREEGRKDVP